MSGLVRWPLPQPPLHPADIRPSRPVRPPVPAAPLALANDFEGATDGATITTSSGTGDLWDAVNLVGGASTALYEDTSPLVGSLIGRMTVDAAQFSKTWVAWGAKVGTRARVWSRCYFRFPTAIPEGTDTNVRVFAVGTDGTLGTLNINLRVYSDGTLRILNWAEALLATFTTTISAGVWYRVEVDQTASGGAYDVRLFAGANLHAAVGSFTEQKTGSGSGQTHIGGVGFGASDSGARTSATVLDLDAVGVSSVDWVGPAEAGVATYPHHQVSQYAGYY